MHRRVEMHTKDPGLCSGCSPAPGAIRRPLGVKVDVAAHDEGRAVVEARPNVACSPSGAGLSLAALLQPPRLLAAGTAWTSARPTPLKSTRRQQVLRCRKLPPTQVGPNLQHWPSPRIEGLGQDVVLDVHVAASHNHGLATRQVYPLDGVDQHRVLADLLNAPEGVMVELGAVCRGGGFKGQGVSAGEAACLKNIGEQPLLQSMQPA